MLKYAVTIKGEKANWFLLYGRVSPKEEKKQCSRRNTNYVMIERKDIVLLFFPAETYWKYHMIRDSFFKNFIYPDFIPAFKSFLLGGKITTSFHK